MQTAAHTCLRTGRMATQSVTTLGARVRCRDKLGTVMYYGKPMFLGGEKAVVGVALDEPVGKHDGSVLGERLFTCPDNHGIFCKAKHLVLAPGGDGETLASAHRQARKLEREVQAQTAEQTAEALDLSERARRIEEKLAEKAPGLAALEASVEPVLLLQQAIAAIDADLADATSAGPDVLAKVESKCAALEAAISQEAARRDVAARQIAVLTAKLEEHERAVAALSAGAS